MDDFLIIGKTRLEADTAFRETTQLLEGLGFVINMEKSQQKGVQKLEFLGFVIDSVSMTICLPLKKVKDIKQKCSRLLRDKVATVRQLSQIIGTLVATNLAVLPAPLHYRALQALKIEGLHRHHSYESIVILNYQSSLDLQWWITHLAENNGRPILQTAPDLTIESDASNMGWGAHCNNLRTGGQWSAKESLLQFNAKEMLAAFLAIQTFARDQQATHVRMKIDNNYDFSILHQSQGRYSLSNFDGSHLGDLELVHTEKDLSVGGALTGQTERCSRPGIEDSGGQFGVETRSKCFSTGDVESGTMSDRSFRLKTHSSTSYVHKLETRPRVNGYRCLESELVNSEVLRFLSFLSHRKVPSQSKAGEGPGVGTGCSSLADTTVVPCTDVNDTSTAHVSPKHNKFVAKSKQRGSPPGTAGVPETSRMACIRSSLQNQGISRKASEIILASWRHNTVSAYSCNWRRWESWCHERKYNPLCATFSQILEFLTSEFAGGKQYRTLNSYRSAISMTHPPIDGVVVGKHPIVSRFMRGVFNSRPPQPRYTFTWDVSKVLHHIKVLGSNESLSFKKLTHKLATILALANASRSSEIHALDVSYMKVSQAGVTFTLGDLTKTSRPGKQRSLFYPALKEDKILCPVNTLSNYLSRTKGYRQSERSQSRLFLTVVKPFKPAHKSTIACKVDKNLTS